MIGHDNIIYTLILYGCGGWSGVGKICGVTEKFKCKIVGSRIVRRILFNDTNNTVSKLLVYIIIICLYT